MKLKNILHCGIAILASTSCIQDEALNIEAAIDGCTGNSIQLASINHDDKKIDLYVNQGISLDTLRIHFELPEGATVKPENLLSTDNEPIFDFSKNMKRNFIVTSENGKIETKYTLEAIITNLPTFYGFENLLDGTNKYDIFTERQLDNEGEFRFIQWASGNPGFTMTGLGNTRTDYPTVQDNGGVNGGKCVKLTTKKTGAFGASFGMPIAAGNLFIGSFDQAKATFKPLEATKLGFPFKEKPISMSGWYKFKSGDVFTDKYSNVIEGKKDKCDIYGILYEVDEKTNLLNGSNSLTSPNLVLMARISQEDIKETNEWTKFNITFDQVKNGKTFSYNKMKEGKYKLSIVLSSSVEGANFNGAVGSTLYVDDIEVKTEKN